MDELEAGRYRLLERIGSGGMAEVWRARDERTGDEVALKRLHAEARADPTARERFAREVDALRAIQHPLAVPVKDAAVDTRDARLVMELFPGGSLRDRLATGLIGASEAARLGADVASVLAAAHEVGFVHRDVTPANILFDARGRARLIDYGVATVPVDWGRDAVTATTDVVGTLQFIAPEVLEGAAATSAADVWGLGAVLWEAVAGRPPFAAGSPAALLEARRAAAPPLPGDPVLASLVASMLARDPADRPPAAIAATGLQRIAANLEAEAGEVTTVMPVPDAAADASTEDSAAAPVAWRSPDDLRPIAAASVAPDSRAAGTRGASPSTPSRGRALAGAAIVGLAILGLAIAGTTGLPRLPAGANASQVPTIASPELSQPPAEDIGDGQGAKAQPGRGNNGNGNGGNGNGNGGNGNGNGNGRDKDKGGD